MNIVLVDDDPVVLRVCVALLEHQGHHVRAYTNATAALASLATDVDLVLSDANLQGLDGFDLASAVATRLGSLPPKTLLFSSSTPGKDVEDTAPDVVIGLLSKPVRASVLWDIVELLEKTRSCCPGLIAELCPYTRDGAVPDGRPCDSVLYASCEHYRKTCGRELRRWIADRQHPHADWPEAQAAS